MTEKFFPRGLLALAALAAALLFAVGAAPTPPPGPPSPPVGEEPVVLVYPFDVQTGADPRIGSAIAQILAQEMAAAGGITVLRVPVGIKRADFLDNARTDRADFYISGYVTPVGDSAAVVEQVVSVESGVILFSQTAQVASVADVASQSLLARSQILAFVGRGTESVQTQPANTPAPTSTNGAQVPIRGLGNIVNSVFKHKSGSPTPKPAAVVKPERGVIVAPVTSTGQISPTDLTGALHELFFAIDAHYNAQMTSVTSNAAQSSDAICGSNRDNTIATGTLQESAPHHGKNQVTFELLVYTCFGAVLEKETGKGSSIKSAVDSAVSAYATAHPDNS